MDLDDMHICEDCGHADAYHHPTLTRGDGCIGRPGSTQLATLAEIRAGAACGCPLEWDPDREPAA